MNNTESTAHRLIEKGLSVIPVDMRPDPEKECRPRKAALVPWVEFQSRKPTDDEIGAWFKKFPDAGLGIITGQTSNLTVIDVDSPEAQKKVTGLLPEDFEAPIVTTPRPGEHHYFSFEDTLATRAGLIPGLDVRSQGGYVCCPPTPGYSWAGGGAFSVFDLALNKMPLSLKSFILSLYIRQPQKNPATSSHKY
jgi:hypothetical protein